MTGAHDRAVGVAGPGDRVVGRVAMGGVAGDEVAACRPDADVVAFDAVALDATTDVAGDAGAVGDARAVPIAAGNATEDLSVTETAMPCLWFDVAEQFVIVTPSYPQMPASPRFLVATQSRITPPPAELGSVSEMPYASLFFAVHPVITDPP